MNAKERVEQLCKESNITMEFLAESIGRNKSTFSRWNSSAPSSAILSDVADYFGVSVDYLLGRKQGLSLSPDESRLLDLFRVLTPEAKRTLLDNAEYAASRHAQKTMASEDVIA